jgi:DNA-binding CsgD family transcriptional regulator
MVKRVLYVGGMEELERVHAEYHGRLVASTGHYVFGEFCEATEESGLLWEDLRKCYAKAHLTSKQRFAHSRAIKLVPFSEIAEKMGCTHQTVADHVRAAEAKLDGLIGHKKVSLGCFTQIVESCGGWEAVRHYVADIGKADQKNDT